MIHFILSFLSFSLSLSPTTHILTELLLTFLQPSLVNTARALQVKLSPHTLSAHERTQIGTELTLQKRMVLRKRTRRQKSARRPLRRLRMRETTMRRIPAATLMRLRPRRRPLSTRSRAAVLRSHPPVPVLFPLLMLSFRRMTERMEPSTRSPWRTALMDSSTMAITMVTATATLITA
ncbi:hypothetical protein F5882DRAFT_172991 [Hyaloscypha sp. PMI_1271]|nr:hypothetical protein F5882DRAFT_172991 [Hyaloscypha sp. PMI_1271]